MLDLRLDAEKATRIARAAAYVEFLKSFAEIAKFQESGAKVMVVDGLKALTEAKAGIAVYGSEQVVSAIAEFERFGPVLNSPDSIKRYVHIVQKMREDGGEGVTGVSGEDVAKLQFGSEFVEKL